MPDWHQSNGHLEIDYRPEKTTSAGCFPYFAGALFICFLGFMSLLLYTVEASTVAKTGAGLLLLLFTIIGLHTMIHNLRGSGSLDLQDVLLIDTKTEELRITNIDTKLELRYGLGEFDFVEIRKTKHRMRRQSVADDSPAQMQYFRYHIYLIKKDGSTFWIYTEREEERFLEKISILNAVLGLEVRDETELGLAKDAVRNYHKTIPTRFKQSKWVAERDDEHGRLYTLNEQKHTLEEKVVRLSVFSVFALFPVLIMLEFVVPMLSKESATWQAYDYGILIFTSLFCLFYFICACLLIAGQFKKYFIRLNENEIDIRVHFSIKPADRLFGKYMQVPKNELRIAAVHRTSDGGHRLSLATKSQVMPQSGSSFLAKMGVFDTNQQDSQSESDYLLMLWSLSGVRYRNGPNAEDLAYIAQSINDKYVLSA